ncbi:glutaminyl-peptide cyclotransferase [Chitinophagaceae bacterium LWZ2-11]
MNKTVLSILGIALILTACNACNNDKPSSDSSSTGTTGVTMPATLSYTVLNVYPHDTAAFTEGLEWHGGFLYESTGEHNSKLAKVNLKDGKDVQKITFPSTTFGEGITVINDKLYQLTYQQGVCYVYDFKTFKKIGEFTYDGEGWGMTTDGKHLINNNGGDKLYFRDPETFKVTNIVSVSDNNGPLGAINELEWVDGVIYANVYMTNTIVKIDPETGKVLAKADMSGLLEKYGQGANIEHVDVLNGIAYNKDTKTFYITGKYWPKLFEVKFN